MNNEMDNEINDKWFDNSTWVVVRHRDKDGKFVKFCEDTDDHDDYETTYDHTKALIADLTSGSLDYSRVVEIWGCVDIDLIYEKLGNNFFGEDAIIFVGPTSYIYPSMDALMTPWKEDDDFPSADFPFCALCNFEGPLDTDILFSVDDFMAVLDSEFDGNWVKCERLDVNINYPTVGFGEKDDHRYAFMNSKINQPIDKWKVDERAITLDAWFANSEFNQPLNNWKLTKLNNIDGIFFRSKYNHPLDKWFSKPITISAQLAFAESECHQDLSMWKINPTSVCDGMFYKSKYTIEEVSAWSWVKNLDTPIEDLFRITEKAEDWHSWLLDAIEH